MPRTYQRPTRRVSQLECTDPAGNAILVGVTSDNVARLWAVGVPPHEVATMHALLETGLDLIEPRAALDARLRLLG